MKRQDALSLELYITLAVLTGIIGVVLLPLAVFPDVPLAMRVVRVATGLLLLIACQRASRVALRRIRARRAARQLRSDPERLREDVLALLQSGRGIAAVRLYREVTGVGFAEAKRQVDRLSAEARRRRES
jgi:ribosomal protein L7/L12